MSQKEVKKGIVTKKHPHLYDVKLEDGTKMKAYPAGRMKQDNISILEGDKVKVEVPKTGTKGRIIWRIT